MFSRLLLGKGLTVRDSSYLVAAMYNGLALVTDDRRPGEKASKLVSVLNSGQLAEELGELAPRAASSQRC